MPSVRHYLERRNQCVWSERVGDSRTAGSAGTHATYRLVRHTDSLLLPTHHIYLQDNPLSHCPRSLNRSLKSMCITLTLPACRMLRRSGRCSVLRSLSDRMPCLCTIATRYNSDVSVPVHFMSGSKMKPVSLSLSSNTIRSASVLCSSILYTHWNKLIKRANYEYILSQNHIVEVSNRIIYTKRTCILNDSLSIYGNVIEA